MTAGPSIDPARFLQEELAEASPDLMRELLTTPAQTLPTAVNGAAPSPPHPCPGNQVSLQRSLHTV
jgi:hypothetical protein